MDIDLATRRLFFSRPVSANILTAEPNFRLEHILNIEKITR